MLLGSLNDCLFFFLLHFPCRRQVQKKNSNTFSCGTFPAQNQTEREQERENTRHIHKTNSNFIGSYIDFFFLVKTGSLARMSPLTTVLMTAAHPHSSAPLGSPSATCTAATDTVADISCLLFGRKNPHMYTIYPLFHRVEPLNHQRFQ